MSFTKKQADESQGINGGLFLWGVGIESRWGSLAPDVALAAWQTFGRPLREPARRTDGGRYPTPQASSCFHILLLIADCWLLRAVGCGDDHNVCHAPHAGRFPSSTEKPFRWVLPSDFCGVGTYHYYLRLYLVTQTTRIFFT